MGSSHTLDRLDSCFDDTHAVANAGLLLAATLAERLGIEQAADACSTWASGLARTGPAASC
jgi:hypothetical protein